MATWPVTLPQSPLLDGYVKQPQNSVLRSDFDGYTKQRNRFTAVINNVTERYFMTDAQFTAFKTFYFTTLNNGADEFTKNDTELGVDASFRFTEPFTPERVGLNWIVTCNFERLP